MSLYSVSTEEMQKVTQDLKTNINNNRDLKRQ